MTTPADDALRSALGVEGYRDVLRVGELLDDLVDRGLLSHHGLTAVVDELARQLVARAVFNAAKGLPDEAKGPDTSTPEAPSR